MEPLRVAIVHYHFRPGGVTSVVARAAAALEGQVRYAVFCGEAPAETDGLPPAVVLPDLGYAGPERGETPGPAARLAAELRAAARSVLGGAPDLWHFHNHHLGKNALTPAVVRELAAAGERLLLQIHDFPEDGRPENYRFLLEKLAGGEPARLGEWLYPAGPGVHYAVLNGRDFSFLAAAGVPEPARHLLPNCVAADPAAASPATGDWERLWLYPTRAIRRKNVGEILFWAALAEPDEVWGLTRAPRNPQWADKYQGWVRLAAELKLPVRFALGETAPYQSLLAGATGLVTTSVAEGFGLAFLESWLLNKTLVGRNLPEVTAEFAAAGLDLTELYDFLPIPTELVDLAEFRRRLAAGLAASARAYGRELPALAAEQAEKAVIRGGNLDFGALDEELQADVIRQAGSAPATARDLLKSCNSRSFGPVAPKVLAGNRRVVENSYDLKTYARRLQDIYAAVIGTEISPHPVDAEGLCARFLAPERFRLLRA